jgi:hypothetical protein
MFEEFEKLIAKFNEDCEEFKKNLKEKETKLELEDHNFRVDSNGWKKETKDGVEYLINPEGDITEYIGGKFHGEQLFTWDAAIRETQKAGKRMPTDDELSEILKTKEDLKNIVYAGYHSTDGSFYERASHAYLWSSLQFARSYFWNRVLHSGYSKVFRNYNTKAFGFSVRCIRRRRNSSDNAIK